MNYIIKELAILYENIASNAYKFIFIISFKKKKKFKIEFVKKVIQLFFNIISFIKSYS